MSATMDERFNTDDGLKTMGCRSTSLLSNEDSISRWSFHTARELSELSLPSPRSKAPCRRERVSYEWPPPPGDEPQMRTSTGTMPLASPETTPLARLHLRMASFGLPKFLLPPDEAISWEEHAPDIDGSVAFTISLSSPATARVDMWTANFETEIHLTVMPNGTLRDVQGITAGAAHLKGVSLRVHSVECAESSATVKFRVKPPFLPSFTVPLNRNNFEHPDAWEA